MKWMDLQWNKIIFPPKNLEDKVYFQGGGEYYVLKSVRGVVLFCIYLYLIYLIVCRSGLVDKEIRVFPK